MEQPARPVAAASLTVSATVPTDRPRGQRHRGSPDAQDVVLVEGLSRLHLRRVGGDPPPTGLVGVRPQVAARPDLATLPRREPEAQQPVGAERRQGGVDLAHGNRTAEGQQPDQDRERVAARPREEIGRECLLAAERRHGDGSEARRHGVHGEVGRGEIGPQCRQERGVDDGRGTHRHEGMPGARRMQ